MAPPILPKLKDIEAHSPYVTRILAQNAGPFTLQGTNTYLVGDPRTKDRLLIDTGSGMEEYHTVLSQYVKKHGINIVGIVLTHRHPDHLGGLNDVVDIAPNAILYRFMGAATDPHRRHDFYKLVDEQSADHYESLSGNKTFVGWADNETKEIAGVHIKAYYTPGHCSDHLSFWLEEEGALFSGDNLLGNGSTVFEDYHQYMSSLRRMRNLPRLKRVYPGHGKIIEDGIAAFNDYMEHRQRGLTRVWEEVQASEEPVSETDLARVLYKDLESRPEIIRAGAVGNTLYYLGELERLGKVKHDEDKLWKTRL